MSKQFYKYFNFRSSSLEAIERIDAIVDEYTAQGYRLTVRQLYYQLVARNIIENTERSYKNTTNLVNDARLAGLLDWEAIEDRTREFIKRSRWNSGAQILRSVAQQYHMDMWANQKCRVFVIVEKEALAGVLERVCNTYDIPLLAARGYPSGTVLREFCMLDLAEAYALDQRIIILHLGDHDPSGIDMSRDLEERLIMFHQDSPIYFKRIALNMAQIDEKKPPANPAKVTDSRFASYAERFGEESWELDALEPAYLTELIDSNVAEYIEPKAWKKRLKEIADIKERLTKLSGTF